MEQIRTSSENSPRSEVGIKQFANPLDSLHRMAEIICIITGPRTRRRVLQCPRLGRDEIVWCLYEAWTVTCRRELAPTYQMLTVSIIIVIMSVSVR